MSLDIDKLEKVVVRNGKVIARCPACAENGEDATGNHLFIEDGGEGRFGCVVNPGALGGEHRKRIWALAGITGAHPEVSPISEVRRQTNKPVANQAQKIKQSYCFPTLEPLNEELLEVIRELREWPSTVGMEFLAARGLLWDGDIFDNGAYWPAWIITDSSRMNAQARTYDGRLWEGIGGKKAKSLPGTKAAWPIGAPDIGNRPNVILCEGQPDFCAALLVAWFENKELVETVAPVCITGAGNLIHADALRYFTGKRVRIATHNDSKGQEAAERWAKQLIGAMATVDQINFRTMGIKMKDGRPVKDLADYATLLDVEDFPDVELFADWLDL